MKKSEVACGEHYIVKVSGKLATVKIVGPSPFGGWIGRNVDTGREVRLRSAARLRRPAADRTECLREGS